MDESARGGHVPAMPEAVGRGSEVTQLLTIKAAAKASNIGYGTLRRIVKDGLITVVMLPGQRTPMLDPADLDALIAASKVGTTAGTEAILPENHVTDFKSLEITPHPVRSRVSHKSERPYYERFARKNG